MFFNLRSRSNADLAKKVQAAERDKAAREAAAAKRAPPARAGLRACEFFETPVS